mmetsp:Transcript_106127/g.342664  ORF Transcript_106127/g.342664 Transcript_106127/m.342664 type:complete len:207 (+) Transcript_106127:1885-2505(+)
MTEKNPRCHLRAPASRMWKKQLCMTEKSPSCPLKVSASRMSKRPSPRWTTRLLAETMRTHLGKRASRSSKRPSRRRTASEKEEYRTTVRMASGMRRWTATPASSRVRAAAPASSRRRRRRRRRRRGTQRRRSARGRTGARRRRRRRRGARRRRSARGRRARRWGSASRSRPPAQRGSVEKSGTGLHIVSLPIAMKLLSLARTLPQC